LDDEDDNKGDSHAFRITPEKFAILAESAIKGEKAKHEVIKQPVSKPQAKTDNAHAGHDHTFDYSHHFDAINS